MTQGFDSLYKVRSPYKAINGWRAGGGVEELFETLALRVVAEGGKAKGVGQSHCRQLVSWCTDTVNRYIDPENPQQQQRQQEQQQAEDSQHDK